MSMVIEKIDKRKREWKGVWHEYKGMSDLKLNLGCARNVIPGYINIDAPHISKTDVSLNLESAILPFEDGSCCEVVGEHIFQRIDNFIALVNEIWRVLKPGGVLKSSVPCVTSVNIDAFHSPANKRYFTEVTWRYFCMQYPEHKDEAYMLGIKPFKLLRQSKDGNILKSELIK